jgi:hypothetical protein
MSKSFTIQIFVPDGDPESIKVIDKFGWTGKGLSFPRQKWPVVKNLPEVSSIGVYILTGYGSDLSENNSELIDDDLPTIYIGQADPLQNRIDQHYRNKDFWDRCITFSTTDNSLNRAYVNWIEYALIEKAKASGRCHLNNEVVPKQPTLSQADKANMENFLEEILQILPLVNIRVFEAINPVATPNTTLKNEPSLKGDINKDTIVVPAQKEGFNRVFINENCWYSIRISGGMLEKIKYIAVYQTSPVSSITHYAPVEKIEPYGDNNKYKVIFSQSAKALDKPISYGNASSGCMQTSRYTSFSKLMKADTLTDLFPKK